jgi:hypothetical protein
MVKQRKRWWHPVRRIALFAIVPVVVILSILAMPVWIPLLGWSMAHEDRRKRKLVETWPCGWCVAPLGADALARADALEAAQIRHSEEGVWAVRYRRVRILHACCTRCGAAHEFQRQSPSFALLGPQEIDRRFGALMDEAVPTPTCRMAWPWLRPASAMHAIEVTRDPIDARGEIDPPPAGQIEVPADVDVAVIAEALLRSPWLPDLGPSASWRCTPGAILLEFGKQDGMPFVRRSGDMPLRANAIAQVHIVYGDNRNGDCGPAGAT